MVAEFVDGQSTVVQHSHFGDLPLEGARRSPLLPTKNCPDSPAGLTRTCPAISGRASPFKKRATRVPSRTRTTWFQAHGDLRCEALFDAEHDRYALIPVGWNAGKRVHFTLVHIDFVGDKVWIEKDNTEDGVAAELVQAGIPKSQIVLAFHSPEVMKFKEYAVA